MNRPTHLQVNVPVEELTSLLERLCPGHGIDLAGAVGLPGPLPLAGRFRAWLDEGRHGDLGYMTRDSGRIDSIPTLQQPSARSLLVFAQRYTAGWPQGDGDPSAGGTEPAANRSLDGPGGPLRPRSGLPRCPVADIAGSWPA